MPEAAGTTAGAPRAIRLGALAIAAATAALAVDLTIASVGWLGRPFPGFLLLDNGVVASVALGHWSGASVDGLYRSEVVAVDGARVATADEIYRRVAARPLGAPVRFTLLRHGTAREVTLRTQRFGTRDWLLVFGPLLGNALVAVACGLVVWLLRPRAAVARAFLVLATAGGAFLLTALDLYGPARLFRLHVAAEAIVPAALLHLTLLFPHPHRLARWRFAGYGVAAVVLVLYQAFLYRVPVYLRVLSFDMVFLGATGTLMGARLLSEYRRGRSQLVRQRVRVITLGVLFGIALPGVLLLASALVPGGVATNAAVFTPFLFVLSAAYAIVKYDLFEIDAMVKRGAYYLLLTGSVGAAYVAAVVVFNLIMQAGAVTDSPAFPVLFTLAVLLLFNPLRSRLQAFSDRLFFRTRYDGAQVLAGVGARLAATLERERIARIVCDAAEEAIPNGRTRLFVAAGAGGPLLEVGTQATVPPALRQRLAEGHVATPFDPGELYVDARTHTAVRDALAALEAEVAVPLRLGDQLVGVLTVGPKRSGLFYSAGDVEFLRALAHQGAIALDNARTYDALVALNVRLEDRVRERSAQLEAANRELEDAYTELKTAEVQLVHSEKMASLGRLVAGVAHEINNPVTFIATSVAPLRRRLEQAATDAPGEVLALLREAEEIVDIMARGAARTAAIVKDLRSFSRLGEAVRKRADLHDGLEVSLRLLESRWRDRITVHRDYGDVPLVECDPAQMNQVFLNLLANACDAIDGAGQLWITTRADERCVTIAIRDDGRGIAPEAIGHIFDPFFTTKDVGAGTGLGLAVSHSVVAAHGGRIEVESAPGHGATFRIVLPRAVPDLSLDRAASGDR
jgi:signal transduction histidine kinase